MPSSLIVGALVVAWLVVLVPMFARKRQQVARTADSDLAARVVRSGTARSRTEAYLMPEVEQEPERRREVSRAEEEGWTEELPILDAEVGQYADGTADEREFLEVVHADDLPDGSRRYRPGRGGFDPEAAELAKQARYAYRRRVVLSLLVAAVATALFAAVAWQAVWWLHAAIDLSIVGYLSYLRRQVRIEEEIRQRRTARMRAAYREYDGSELTGAEPPAESRQPRASVPETQMRPGTAVVDVDDGDPEFDELDAPGSLPYRRAAGE